MIIDYHSKYDEEIKNLLVELQEHIMKIDKEHYNVVGENFKEEYFGKTMEEIEKYQGKMYLYQEDNKIIGLVVGLINNEEIDTYDFKAPKRGRISELVVSKKYRKQGYGKILLQEMEDYLKSVGCMDILIGVFAYNNSAIHFYEMNGYHVRMTEMIKKDI